MSMKLMTKKTIQKQVNFWYSRKKVNFEITKIEFSYKDQIIRATIEGVQSDMSTIKEDVGEIKAQLDKMDARLYQLTKERWDYG